MGSRWIPTLACALTAAAVSSTAHAQCPTKNVRNYTGGGQTVCPCFASSEEAGSVFTPPAGDFPIEILKVGIGWGSVFGGAPQSLEAAIHVYAAGLPNPGAPIFSLDGPLLTDGAINVFNLEPLPGQIIVNSAPFTVTLEFENENAGDPFAPSVVHDGNGCQSGKNVVYAIPGGWSNACSLGVSGDWVFYVDYRSLNCGGTSGHVPGTSLHITRNPGNGLLNLTWGTSCSATDNDYEVYEGRLGTFYSHNRLVCSTGGATSTSVSPSAGNTYYLVVPADAAHEGSYGRRSDGTERPPGGPRCRATQSVGCP